MDDFEQFKTTWQSSDEYPAEQFANLRSRVATARSDFYLAISQRDLAETLAAVIVVFFFALPLFSSEKMSVRIGSVVIITSSVQIVVTLWFARRKSGSKGFDDNFICVVDREIEFLSRQARLLRNIFWWYFLPINFGLVIFSIGLLENLRPHDHAGASWIHWGAFAAMATLSVSITVWGCILNRRGVAQEYLPRIQYYQCLREAMISGDDESILELQNQVPLLDRPDNTISKRRKVVGWSVAIFAAILTALLGYVMMGRSNERVGIYLIATAPVVAALIVAVSRAWRKTSQGDQGAPPSSV
ncbi:hypothetical protein [Roseiconus lacunae]|uniref:Uncharacterized protein n=1 Tax=Roseiconus lacunae TaxID=2605694 RepID=A0ABT7PRA2_9BACT|nr:hypothetical protein [Roseiconus lacunae]MDM4019023.1 hypothetical protein [Roseiconus lacunae]